jgi:hypothetical protein
VPEFTGAVRDAPYASEELLRGAAEYGDGELSGETGGGADGALAEAKIPLERTGLIDPRMADFCDDELAL